MRECLTELVDRPPETCSKNQNCKTIDGIWITPGLKPINGGYTEYLDSWDHRLVWVDFEEKELFGHNENRIIPPNPRKLKLDQVKSVQKYQKDLKKLYEDSDFESRISTLCQKIDKGMITDNLMEDLNKLDWERTRYMLKSESQCRTFYTGNVLFSDAIYRAGATVAFLKLAIRYQQGGKVSKLVIKRTQIKAKMLPYKWKKLAIKKLKMKLKTKWSQYDALKKYGKLHSKKQIRKKAEEIAEATGEDPDVVEQQLTHRLESKIDCRKIDRLLKDSRNGGLNKLIIPDPRREGKRKECYAQQEIENALLIENKRKYLQTYDTPPLTIPLLDDIGLRGEGPEVDNMLKGNYCPPSTLNEHSKAYSYHRKRTTLIIYQDMQSRRKITLRISRRQRNPLLRLHPDYTIEYGKPIP